LQRGARFRVKQRRFRPATPKAEPQRAGTRDHQNQNRKCTAACELENGPARIRGREKAQERATVTTSALAISVLNDRFTARPAFSR
jgi:hypothetical protein